MNIRQILEDRKELLRAQWLLDCGADVEDVTLDAINEELANNLELIDEALFEELGDDPNHN